MKKLVSQFEVLNIIKKISTATEEEAVKSLSESAIQLAGGEYFIYSTIRENNYTQKHDIHHHFENCSKEWRTIYDRRKWFMNDPFIEYARTHTGPSLGAEIVPVTAGQNEMLCAAANHGFRSAIVIPTHNNLGAQQCMGMLLIGSPTETEIGEPLLATNRLIFRALAMELMDWWKLQFQSRTVQRFKLQPREILILENLYRGKSVAEVAAITDIKPSTLYRQLDLLKVKMNAMKTDDLIRKARFCGLFG